VCRNAVRYCIGTCRDHRPSSRTTILLLYDNYILLGTGIPYTVYRIPITAKHTQCRAGHARLVQWCFRGTPQAEFSSDEFYRCCVEYYRKNINRDSLYTFSHCLYIVIYKPTVRYSLVRVVRDVFAGQTTEFNNIIIKINRPQKYILGRSVFAVLGSFFRTRLFVI